MLSLSLRVLLIQLFFIEFCTSIYIKDTPSIDIPAYILKGPIITKAGKYIFMSDGFRLFQLKVISDNTSGPEEERILESKSSKLRDLR